uniref:Uncharacterized protein n=1 Tax=Cyanophora sudae TaxID=1522369 RepID=A0A873WUY1_9EUKA|nr:hypothetical protein DXZ12_mgp38 [Cyanophora sudae]QPB15054.1 hypothetical protein [Cyanophora sudae]
MLELFTFIQKNQLFILYGGLLSCLLCCLLFFLLIKILFYSKKQFYSSIMYQYASINIPLILFYYIFVEKIIKAPFFILFSKENSNASMYLMKEWGQGEEFINCLYYSGMSLDYDMLLMLTPDSFILTTAQSIIIIRVLFRLIEENTRKLLKFLLFTVNKENNNSVFRVICHCFLYYLLSITRLYVFLCYRLFNFFIKKNLKITRIDSFFNLLLNILFPKKINEMCNAFFLCPKKLFFLYYFF